MRTVAATLLLTLACTSSKDTASLVPENDDGAADGQQDAGGGGSGGSSGSGGADAGGAETGAAVDAAVDAAASSPDSAVASDASADVASLPAGDPFVYVGSDGANEIRIFQLDMETGALMPRGSAPSGTNPNYMAFHPSRKYLYALNEVVPGRIVAFSINPTTGALTRLNDASSGGDGPAHISMHKSGNWVLSSNYKSGHAAALPIMPDGRLGAPIEPRQAGAMAHMIVDDGATGKFVFVPSKGDNRTLQFKFDEATGRLEPNSPASVAQGGSPRHMTFHRSGRYAYLLTELGKTVVSYKYDATTGLLGDGMGLSAAPSGDGAHILLHPTKDFLYASIRFYDAIAIFSINADGRAVGPRHVRSMIARPWDFAIDPTGKYMIVANNDNATVQVFRIDEQDGMLTRIGGASVGGRPRFVGILPPGP